MKIFYLILIFLYKINLSINVDRIWLIRHCDKPESFKDPCCSKLGYERSKKWHIYFKKYFNKNNKINLYSSNFNEKRVCINNIQYKPDSNCQKSQRMFLTAYYIEEQFQNLFYINDNLNVNYCVGEYEKLLKKIKNNDKITDAIIVWEHKEIIDIIRSFNIDIKKWKNKYKNYYDIIFMIDVKTKQLFYDCFDFVKNTTECSSNINLWLDNFKKINIYNQYTYLTLYNKPIYNYEIKYIFIVIFIIIFLFLLVFVIIFIIKKFIENRRRRYYTIII